MTQPLHTTRATSVESTTAQPVRIVIAGGGTGGHLFPGIAIAEEFTARNPANQVLFVSTGNAFERSALADTSYALRTIPAEGIKSRGLFRQLKAVFKVPAGIVASLRILKDFSPQLVVGVGSYAAGPVVVAAWLMGIPNVLHEQNALPGITNRLLSGFAKRIFVSFDDRHGLFRPRKTVSTGNPIRRGLLEAAGGVRPANRPFTVLIVGGSQGAHPINLAVEEALAHLEDQKAFYFIHQTGVQDLERVEATYRRNGVNSTVAPFFKDMDRRYREADLIVCRAGATTIAEITAIGKCVIFIPFPFAADNHQVENARMLTEINAAEMILQQDLTGRLLAERIAYYAAAPGELAAVAERARRLGRPDAGKVIVDHCYRLIEKVSARGGIRTRKWVS